MSVKVVHLSKHFDQQKAVDDVSFEVGKGEILGFLGPNGAGKTTTMKMLCGYLTPTSGSAQICGYDILTQPLQVRRKIGYLPEHNPLYEEMYVREYLGFVASIHKIADKQKRIDEVLELTGMTKEVNKIIGTLSKGYRQRVGLAQAILHDPEVLILDEPTSGLDMNQLADIRQLIRSLGKEKTVIFSSHIMQEVESLCDRVIIINNGMLVADDPISELRGRMKGNKSLRLEVLEEVKDLRIFRNIDGVHQVFQDQNSIVINASGKSDIRADVFRQCVANQLTIIDMHTEEQNIESIFRQLTKEGVGV
jgi:ABC-2 type transport system ATP-binding protein